MSSSVSVPEPDLVPEPEPEKCFTFLKNYTSVCLENVSEKCFYKVFRIFAHNFTELLFIELQSLGS